MATTCGEVLAQLRDRLDETIGQRAWLNPQLRRWINEGNRDIARRAEVLPDTDDVTITADVQEYTLATDILRVHRVQFTPTGDTAIYPLEYRQFNNMDAVWWTNQSISSGIPSFYTMWGYTPNLKLVLYPKPSVGGTCKVYSYRLPTQININGTDDDSNIDIPEGWYDLVLDYAEYRALRKDGDPRWQEAKLIYEQNLNEMIRVTRDFTDQAGVIADEGSPYGILSWLYEG